MMNFELKLEKPKLSRAWVSAATMGLSYFLGNLFTSSMFKAILTILIGGLLPMIPYMVMTNVNDALFVSIGITFVILIVFGYIKNYVTIKTKRAGFYGAVQTLIIGALAAGVSYGIVRALNQQKPAMI
jgi:vacuolar iron transporter family protein